MSPFRALVILLLCAFSVAADPLWVNRGPAAAYVFDLAILPSTSTVFAATNGGVYRSHDGGVSWAAVDALPREQMHAVVADPTDSRFVYAFGLTGGYRSLDGGATWSRVTGIPESTFTNVVIDSTDPAVVYLGHAREKAIYRSTNRGESWTRIEQSAPIHYLLSDAGALYWGTDESLFVSTDQGTAWTQRAVAGNALFALHAAGGTLWAHSGATLLQKSSDRGLTWTGFPRAVPFSGIFAFAWDPVGRATYVSMGLEGVFRALEGETQWTALGISEPAVTAIEVSPEVGLIAGTWGGGVLRSPDKNPTWLAATHPIDTADVEVIVTDPVHASTLYVGGLGGLFRSEDAGQSYQSLGLADEMVTGIAVSGQRIVAATGSGVFLSLDGGATWQKPPGQSFAFSLKALAVDPTNPNRMAVTGNRSVYVSTDQGSTWAQSLSSLVVNAAVIWDPGTSGTLLASTSSGIRRSSNAGQTWESTPIGPYESTITNFFSDPAHPERLYSTTRLNGLLLSTDHGETWTLLDARIADAQDFAVAADGTLYVATLTMGVFRSTDGGTRWELYTSAVPRVPFKAVATEAAASRAVWVGSSTGAYRTREIPPKRRVVRR